VVEYHGMNTVQTNNPLLGLTCVGNQHQGNVSHDPHLPSGKRGYITHLSSTIHTLAMPEYSGYAISKLAITKLGEHVAAEYPNVISTVLHPGMVSTDMTVPKFVYFSQDTRK